jgi:hypothetical protein
MNALSSSHAASEDGLPDVLWEDGERTICRMWRQCANGARQACIAVIPAPEHPAPNVVRRLTHEFALRDDLDDAWALRPLDLVHESGRLILLLEDQGGEPLENLLGGPMELGRFLRVSVALTAALGRLMSAASSTRTSSRPTCS